jgi:hypothetical protein
VNLNRLWGSPPQIKAVRTRSVSILTLVFDHCTGLRHGVCGVINVDFAQLSIYFTKVMHLSMLNVDFMTSVPITSDVPGNFLRRLVFVEFLARSGVWQKSSFFPAYS